MNERPDEPTTPRVRGNRLFILVLLAILLAALGLRFSWIAQKDSLNDEALSYLAAAGKGPAYGRMRAHTGYPIGHWAKQSDWLSFFKPDQAFDFSGVSRSLAKNDIHPPFYFWVLHVAVLVAGPRVVTGPLLNAIIFALTAALFVHLCLLVFRQRKAALVSVAIWAFGPAAVMATYVARPNELLALFVVASTVVLLHFLAAKQRRLWWMLLYGAVLVAGLLTRYLFVFHIAALGTIVVVLFLRRQVGRKQALAALLVPLVSVALAYLAFPAVTKHIKGVAQREQAQRVRLAKRVDRTVAAVKALVPCAGPAVPWVAGAFGAWGIVALIRRRRRKSRIRSAAENGIGPTAAAVATGATTYLLLLLAAAVWGKIPSHALEPWYFCGVWPLLSLAACWLLLQLVRVLDTRGRILFAGVVVLVAVHSFFIERPTFFKVPPSVRRAKAVVADFTGRSRGWPHVILRLDRESDVYVTSASSLDPGKQGWLAQLAKERRSAIYLSSPRWSNRKFRRRLLQAFRQSYFVRQTSRSPGLLVYQLKRRW